MEWEKNPWRNLESRGKGYGPSSLWPCCVTLDYFLKLSMSKFLQLQYGRMDKMTFKVTFLPKYSDPTAVLCSPFITKFV